MNDLTKNETRELTPQEVLWCDAYADAESECYGNATAAAALAKYSKPGNAGWKVKQRQCVRARLDEIYLRNRAGIGKVMSDLERERLLAIGKGDISSAIRASELQGKRLGAFSDKHIFATADGAPQEPGVDPERTEDIKLALELVYAQRYLSSKSVEEIEGKIAARFKTDSKAIEGNFSQSEAMSPPGGGA